MMYDRSQVMQDAAVATGNGSPINTGGLATLGIHIDGTFVGTVTFESLVDEDLTWRTHQFENQSDGSVATTATAAGIYVAPVAGRKLVRARISSYVSGSITVVGLATVAGAGMSFAKILKDLVEHTFIDETLTVSKNSAAFDCEGYSEVEIVVVVSAPIGGTATPTLVPEVQISGDGTTYFHRRTIIDTETQGDLTRLTAPTWEGKLTVVGTYNCQLKDNLSGWMRISLTLGGTNPSFPVVVKGYFR